jgi:deoxyribose-phosphate aldolase
MVINIGKAKEHDFDYIEEEIKCVVTASAGKTTKVIIETCYLNDEEKVECCKAAKAAGATFVKTSTGFGTGGATASDIKLMRETVGAEMGVKASGGVRSYDDVKVMVENGATRIGASSGIQIMKDASVEGE